MTDPSMNASDPVIDETTRRIEAMDPTLPEPPEHDDVPDDADQTEPEDTLLPPEDSAPDAPPSDDPSPDA